MLMIKLFRNIFFLTISFLFISLSAKATHIVGGDFKITMVSNGASSSTYDVQLRLYRDNINGLVQLPNSVNVGIYQVGTNNLVTNKILNITNGNGSIVPLGDPCYTPNPSIVQIQEGIYQNTSSTLSLPNYSFGYYIQYETCCRNGLIDNLMAPTNDGITIMAIIPNPGLGQNSSPDFGDYPTDAYFCVNNIKNFTWPVTDPDGDSLVFSLVAPLDEGPAFGTGNSSPGSNPYPFYPKCVFSAVYNVTNMIGGSPAMSINQTTGEITASPAIQGFFAFAVRVEEYRNGVKIGEVRRDAQYASLPCIISNPPTVSVNNSQGNTQNDSIVIDVYVNENICFDFELGVNDPNDSLYILLSSNDIDLLATYVQPDLLINSLFGYSDWENISGNTVSFNANHITSTGHAGNLGNVYMRYCWVPPCGGVDSVYLVSMDAYSVDCSGYNQRLSNIYVQTINPDPISIDVPNSMTLTYDSVTCLDLYAIDKNFLRDSLYDDTLFLEPTSSYGFDFSGSYVFPEIHSNGRYFYLDFTYTDSSGNLILIDTLYMDNHFHVNNTSSAIGEVGLRFCWTVGCDNVLEKEFDIDFMSFSTICGSDTTFSSSHFEVDLQTSSSQPIPNIFSPNGDDVNDFFQLTPHDKDDESIIYNDPCFDEISVKIYNRWGKKVYESNDPYFKWDGTKNGDGSSICNSGLFLVIIEGFYGSSYDPLTSEIIPFKIKDEYWIQLFRE